MDKCQFSEFSYGYCAIEDLVVWNRSFRIGPSRIGQLPTNGPHHITFTSGGTWRRYLEEPSEEMRASRSEEIEHALQRRIEERSRRPFKEQVIELDTSSLQIVRSEIMPGAHLSASISEKSKPMKHHKASDLYLAAVPRLSTIPCDSEIEIAAPVYGSTAALCRQISKYPPLKLSRRLKIQIQRHHCRRRRPAPK